MLNCIRAKFHQSIFRRWACWGNRLHWYWPLKSQQPGETMQKNHKVQNAHKLTLTEAKWPELKCKPHKNKNLNEQCEVYMCTPCAQSRYTTQVIQHTRVPIIFSHIQSLLLGRCLQVGWGISYAYGKPRYTKCHVTVDVILLRYSPLKWRYTKLSTINTKTKQKY